MFVIYLFIVSANEDTGPNTAFVVFKKANDKAKDFPRRVIWLWSALELFSKALDPEENFYKSESAAFAPREKDIPNFSLPIIEQSWFLEWKERNVSNSDKLP